MRPPGGGHHVGGETVEEHRHHQPTPRLHACTPPVLPAIFKGVVSKEVISKGNPEDTPEYSEYLYLCGNHCPPLACVAPSGPQLLPSMLMISHAQMPSIRQLDCWSRCRATFSHILNSLNMHNNCACMHAVSTTCWCSCPVPE